MAERLSDKSSAQTIKRPTQTHPIQRSVSNTVPQSHSASRGAQQAARDVSPAAILRMQQTGGNRAVQRMLAATSIQARLTVGPANDKYEQEADSVANNVMRTSQPANATKPVGGSQKPDELAQRKPLAQTISPLVQPEAAPEEEEIQEKPSAERASSDGSFEAGRSVEAQLDSQRGSGSALPNATRSFMESRFGSSFANVRVHTGGEASRISRQLNAQAFTKGRDVYFGDGKYNPHSASGQHLIAHELTHVVQQGSAAQRTVQRKGEPPASTRTDEMLETEAGNALTPDPTPGNPALADTPATRYELSVGVWRQNSDLLNFIKTRAKSTFRNKMRSAFKWMPGVRKAKTAAETKMASAKRVVAAKPGASGLSRPQMLDQARTIANSGNAVGHTWIKLTSYVGSEIQKTSSFGLFPEGVVARPDQTLPGLIRHPDPHKDEAGAKHMHYPVTHANYRKVLSKIQHSIRSRVPYNIKSSNCTTFARDMAKLAGATIPNSATVIPYGPFGMFSETLFNPNQLYENMPEQEAEQ